MIIPLTGVVFAMPGRETFVDHEVDFKVQMGAVFGDPVARIGGPAHDPQGFAAFDFEPGPDVIRDAGEVRVKREDLPTLKLVAQDQIDAVVGEAGFRVDVGDGAVGRGEDRVQGFAFGVALDGSDIEAFVELVTFRADATKRAAGPGTSHRAREELLLGFGVQQGQVGRRQAEEWRHLGCGGGFVGRGGRGRAGLVMNRIPIAGGKE